MAAPDQGNEGAGAAGGAAVGDDADGVAQLQEITDYFKFSVKPDATYRGTVRRALCAVVLCAVVLCTWWLPGAVVSPGVRAC